MALSAFAVARASRLLELAQENSDSEDHEEFVERNMDSGEVDRLNLQLGILPPIDDSASTHDLESDLFQISSQLAQLRDVQLSTWTPMAENVLPITDKCTRIRMKAGEIITFIGQYDLKVKTGLVTVYGARINASSDKHRVFAPSTHALPSIECTTTEAELEIFECSHTMRPLSKLTPLHRRIWNHYRPNTMSETISRALHRPSFSFLSKSRDDGLNRMLVPLLMDLSWSSAMRRISKCTTSTAAKVLVCGPKGSGKSTFGRALVNHLLGLRVERKESLASEARLCTSVFWLDLDPGHPEFSPPGQFSLIQIRKPILGPPFSHPSCDFSTAFRIIRAHTIAVNSPTEDSVYFLKCVMDLLQHYNQLQESFSTYGLVINCPSWVKGSTSEITSELIELSDASDVVLMGDSSQILEGLTEAANRVSFHIIHTSHSVTLTTRTPADFRTMQNVAYFHQCDSTDGEPRWSDTLIEKHTPWTLSFSESDSDIIGIVPMGEQLDQAFLKEVLEGAMTALCLIETDDEVAAAIERVSYTKVERLPILGERLSKQYIKLNPRASHMVGIALIHSIDLDDKTLKLHTPIPNSMRAEILMRGNNRPPRLVLITGTLDTPGWAYLEHKLSRPEHKRRFDTIQTSTEIMAENLALPKRNSTGSYEESDSDTEIGASGRAWVKKVRRGEVIGQRWRVRKDIGRIGAAPVFNGGGAHRTHQI